MNYKKHISQLLIIVSLVFSQTSLSAADWEFSAHFGQMWAPDLDTANGNETVSIDDGNNFGFGLSWQDSPNGQGQILLNVVSHDYISSATNEEFSLDILYGHFNGVALFKQQNYTTTVSLGLGGAMFDSQHSEEVYPSATVALGTRYQFSDSLSFFTELRAYASLVDEDDNVFCSADICHAQFEDSLWLDTNISVGLAFKF